MKGLKLFLTAGVFTALGLTGVNALEVTSETELKSCLDSESQCVLKNDITASSIEINGKTVTLDLNGKTLTASILATNKANLTIKDSGEKGLITTDNTGVTLKESSKLVLESGTISSNKRYGVDAQKSTFVMNGGTVIGQEFGVTYLYGSNITMNDGIVEARDNAAFGDYGKEGTGGNVVTINGGDLISSIVSKGYISCGIYNSNDTTLTVKSGVKITANDGGAGIVIRGGKVTIAKDVIDNMLTGTAEGRVGDSKVIVAGKVVKDYASNYPAKDTLSVTIDYTTVTDKDGENSIKAKQQDALNKEINNVINANKIPTLNNVDLADVAIKTVVEDVNADLTKEITDKAKDVTKDFKVAKALDLSVVITNNGQTVYNLTETTNKIPFGIDVKSIATDNKLNYEFQVVRYHVTDSGEEKFDVLESSYDAEKGTVSFESDKFSTYLISYKTSVKTANETEVPKTGDGIGYVALGLLLSALAMAGITYKLKKN